MVRISLLDDAFSKILELTGNWQLAVSNGSKMTKTIEKGKAKKKAGKSLLGIPVFVPKNVTKRDAIAKKGMFSCLILSSLDS